jgi:hypothetical protein
MIRQNSERIFLEPIDQHYNDSKIKETPEDDDQTKFFEDYTHGVMDCLDISTDSDTKHNSFEDEVTTGKLTELLVVDWKNNIDYFKTYQLSVLRSFVFQKMHFLRSTLNMSNYNQGHGLERSMSCPTVSMRNDWQSSNPFNLRKDEGLLKLDLDENGVINVPNKKEVKGG